jgi:hypothetical protein
VFLLYADVGIVIESGQTTLHSNLGHRDFLDRRFVLFVACGVTARGLVARVLISRVRGYMACSIIERSLITCSIVGRSIVARDLAISPALGNWEVSAYSRVGKFLCVFCAHEIDLLLSGQKY